MDSPTPQFDRPLPDVSSAAHSVAAHYFGRRPVPQQPWRWDGAVAVLGLSHWCAVCPGGSSRWMDDLHGYQRQHLGQRRIAMADHCAPALCSELLLRREADTEASFAVDRTVRYLLECPRNELGVLDHLGTDTFVAWCFPRSIWVDSLMMYVCVASRLGHLLGDDRLRRFAVGQVGVFARALQSPEGWFRHAFFSGWRRCSAAPWLRGNGWAAAALVDMVELEGPRPELVSVLRPLLVALHRARRDDGLWPTVLDDPTSYPEISGSALVAYALAKAHRLGLASPGARTNATVTARTILRRATPTSAGLMLPPASLPTIPGPRRWYRHVPVRRDLPYTVGAFLMLAAELRSRPPDRDPSSPGGGGKSE